MTNTLMILVAFCLSVCSISEGLPKITVEPSDVVEGEPVTLTCTVDSPDIYYITWYRNSTYITDCIDTRCYDSISYYNTTMNRLNRTSSIYIQNVSKSRDRGPWKCKDQSSPFYDVIKLDVKEITGHLTLIRPENTRFVAGQSIDITCNTEVTYPATNITWYIETADNKLYEDITTDIEDGVSTSRLTLTLDKHLNNHTLYCSAFNGYGEVQTDFLKLDVPYPPTIHILTKATSIAIAEKTSKVIAEGEQILLICFVLDANPRVPPRGYSWSRNGIKLKDQTSDIFKVDSTSSHDTGDYTCTGNNGIGTGVSSPVKIYADPRVKEDKSGVVTGLAVCLALFMVLSIALSLLVAYLMLTNRRSTIKTNESVAISRITSVVSPNNTINESSNYEGLELDTRYDNQYTSFNVVSVPDSSPERVQEYDNQASDTVATNGDNSLYENVERAQA
ncbi:B-cell receptor CD22 isoform X1 [Patella vulgata]|uniref:B-cell receptor CD22 isoform X1 n=1 Tax=Patella vulgata TaxID=6465 RepID=UPI0024A89850|nr:B-cell receptor CD22 isoform X1 [Patella vulgata]